MKPKRVYTDKNSGYIEPVKEDLEAKHGILHTAVTPVERSHVAIKRRYSVMRGFGSFRRAFQFTWNWETIYGYVGNLNASTPREREGFCQKIQWLFRFEKASIKTRSESAQDLRELSDPVDTIQTLIQIAKAEADVAVAFIAAISSSRLPETSIRCLQFHLFCIRFE